MSLKRSLSRRDFLASASMVAAGAAACIPQPSAFAEEVNSSESVPSSSAIEFLYIDSAEMFSGEQQDIVVALKDCAEISSATLTLQNVDTGSNTVLDISKAHEGTALFTFNPSEAGSYEIISLQADVTKPTPSYLSIDFSDADSSYRSFSVAYEASTFSLDSSESESSPALQVYADNGAGEITESTSIEEGASIALASAEPAKARSVDRSKTFVVALDPGHVGVTSGAVAFNTQEATATWKIAQYCKAELETYEGVKVVYTVQNGQRLNYGTELQDRVNNAVASGANVLVSLHLNSTGNGSAHGAEVWAPYNSNYNNETHAVGTELANRIIDMLDNLGLANRGVKFRVINGDPDYKYPNGADGDYYGIIRNARKDNLPAIIVEHAFIDNWNDFNRFLNSEAKLQSLGIADASGIASYLGLQRPKGTVFRLYLPSTLDHHYTVDPYEYQVLVQRGWVAESIAWKSPEKSNVPVYRLYYPPTLDHHYTIGKNEYDTLGTRGWVKEGIAWYSDEAEGVPVYRLYNPYTKDHHYTVGRNEYDVLATRGWIQEGIAWYGLA